MALKSSYRRTHASTVLKNSIPLPMLSLMNPLWSSGSRHILVDMEQQYRHILVDMMQQYSHILVDMVQQYRHILVDMVQQLLNIAK